MYLFILVRFKNKSEKNLHELKFINIIFLYIYDRCLKNLNNLIFNIKFNI